MIQRAPIFLAGKDLDTTAREMASWEHPVTFTASAIVYARRGDSINSSRFEISASCSECVGAGFNCLPSYNAEYESGKCDA